MEHGDLISYNGTVLNLRTLLEKAEHTEGGRLYLESKIHTLEVKLGEPYGPVPLAGQVILVGETPARLFVADWVTVFVLCL